MVIYGKAISNAVDVCYVDIPKIYFKGAQNGGYEEDDDVKAQTFECWSSLAR
jgi:hypothetical protein